MQYRTPGAYVVDENNLTNALAAIAPGAAAFLGYTQKTGDGDAAGPVLIESIRQFEQHFGTAQAPEFSLAVEEGTQELLPVHNSRARFFLYHSLLSYFDNGGGPAYVLSTGTYEDGILRGKQKEDFLQRLEVLGNVAGVGLIVAPDTALLDGSDDCYAVWQAVLEHCGAMGERMALIDVHGGGQPRTRHAQDDIISGSKHGLRASLGGSFLGFGAAYYPWLHFNLIDPKTITYDNLDDTALAMLSDALLRELDSASPPLPSAERNTLAALYHALGRRAGAYQENRAAHVADTHRALLKASALYYRLAALLLALANQLPPGAAMAGVYARTDAMQGVWHAPANTGITGAVALVEELTQQDHEGLNLPPDGKAVNAIRTFPGAGLLVWGARTLDGNSDDWRYVQVRRTAIMLEQSIKAGMQAFVFSPNDTNTWAAVRSMIASFLTGQWHKGALLGASPHDAFHIEVGLDSTMTANDIIDGVLRMRVGMALIHPAEFIELTFEQIMAQP